MDFQEELSSEYDSAEEDLGLLRKALDVELPQDFDPRKVPQNGEEYLQHVMYEAKKCQQMVVVPLAESKRKPSTKITLKENCIKAPQHVLPSKEWQEKTIANFTLFCKFLNSKEKPTCSKEDFKIKKLLKDGTPKLSIVNALGVEDKVKALETITENIKELKPGQTISENQGTWIYSLLSTLELPLFPDTCHCLRELARVCSTVRSALPQDAKEADYVPLNLIICIIARYFRQLDLADEETED